MSVLHLQNPSLPASRQPGFTVLEVMVSVALLGAVLAVVLTGMISSGTYSGEVMITASDRAKGRQAVQILRSELAQASPSAPSWSLVDGERHDSVRFQPQIGVTLRGASYGSERHVYVDGTTGNVMLRFDDEEYVLAAEATGLVFEQEGNLVHIELTLTGAGGDPVVEATTLVLHNP